MMKKILMASVAMTAIGFGAHAQKYCVIDSKYILEKVPEYTAAQKQLDAASEGWQQEVDAQKKNVDQMYKSYQAEKALLSETVRTKRENEIVAKEKEVRDLQNRYFGYEGELFKRRQSLVKPIQDRVFNAVQSYASNRGYDIIYDKSAGITIFYASPALDKSDDVIKIINAGNKK